MTDQTIGNDLVTISVCGGERTFLRYTLKATGRSFDIGAPRFSVEGQPLQGALSHVKPVGDPRPLPNGCTEYRFAGALASRDDLALVVVMRLSPDSPVLRFRYILTSRSACRLTKHAGRDRLDYLSVSLADLPAAKEIRLGEFNEMVHSYCLSEQPLRATHFEAELSAMGPVLLAADDGHTLLLAYEHGSMVPDAFVSFRLRQDRTVTMGAVKGNYHDGQVVGPQHPYETLWMQVAAVAGNYESMARLYRSFVLKRMSLHGASRTPYIYYNTWAYQERNKWYNGARYLDSMRQERILREIDVAHRMGIEVFVLDTGWYEKTGDWRVNMSRFPGGLAPVREKLQGYGMKLGLWFSPTHAALSSKALADHRDCLMARQGKMQGPRPVWETEESHTLCLVSRYWKALADELVRLARETGVTYFKWDAIQQYGCDAPGHGHGTAENTEQERADCYAFALPVAMARAVERLCEACPDAIVDFDITEGGRAVGLAFLGVGKYFLINNGPYYGSYNVPIPPTQASNIFVHPGPARGWVCRRPLTYDLWIPSVLFLTHYLPDDPADSQIINIASLILGQNGIWGDLLGISQEGIERFGKLLGLYKQVRHDITESYPVVSGTPGGSPEIYEKVHSATGRGAVVAFSCAPGRYTYLTVNGVAEQAWSTDGVRIERDGHGRAKLEFSFEKPGARIALFGVEGNGQ